MLRFNMDAETIEEAKEYLRNRAIQLLKFNFIATKIETFDEGVCIFWHHTSNKLKDFKSIYILKQYRGMNKYKEILQKTKKYTILTISDCSIERYLRDHKIRHMVIENHSFEYKIIEDFYKDKKAERSKVYLMNHIDEGLYILNQVTKWNNAMKAYCLHPILQSDEDLIRNNDRTLTGTNQVYIFAMEYRNIANAYLSDRKINNINEIKLSPLREVNEMLIADKIQNKKDFELYHINTHPRSKELQEYFHNWFQRLNITEEFYQKMVDDLTIKI